MKAGDKVICIDDTGWLIPKSRGPSPVKGQIYVIQEYEYFGGCAAVSLVGFHEDDFYRACRFQPIKEAPASLIAEHATA